MSLGIAAGCATLGATAGLVFPRAVHRLSVPWGQPPRSTCGNCGEPFPGGRSGWWRPGAACRCLDAPRPRARSTVTASAGAAAVMGWTFGWSPALFGYLAGAMLGVLLAAVDLRCLRLPDRLVAAMALLTVLPLTVAAVGSGEPGRAGRAAVAAIVCFGAYLLIGLLPGNGVGFGDVKLAAVLGFSLGWISWAAVGVGMAVPHLMNGPIAVFLLATGRAGRGTAMPFGPAMLGGALIAVMVTARG